ncbi:MAG: nuclear transport factor 2 family protein [Candidatus Dormibacteraceae bacterium]
MDAGSLTRRLYEAYQARDWAAAGALLHRDAALEMPATAERLQGRATIIAFQAAYPEPCGDLSVLRVVAGDEDLAEAAVEVEVVAATETFRMAGLWHAEADLLRHGVEYWITVGGEEAPPGRVSRRSAPCRPGRAAARRGS